MSKTAKKTNKSKSDDSFKRTPKELRLQFTSVAEKPYSFINRHMLLVSIILTALILILLLLIIQKNTSPTRNDTAYTDGLSGIGYKEIDKEKLKTLEESLESSSVEVQTNFVPNRSNPFSE